MKKIIAPKKLCFYDVRARLETSEFINSLYKCDSVPVKIDFSSTEESTGAAAVFVFAHITHISLCKNNAGYFIFDCKKSPIYKDTFIKKDFLKALRAGTAKKLDELAHDCLFQSGCAENLVEKRKNIMNTLKKLQEVKSDFQHSFKTIYPQLHMAISEILININNHAYHGVNDKKRWWQLMWYDEEEKQFTLFIYDLGVGIEESYRNYATKKRATSIFSPLDELHYFKEALQSGKSRFVGQGRGFGLARIISLVENNDYLQLLLFTKEFVYRGGQKIIYDKNDIDVPGTLVELNYTLP